MSATIAATTLDPALAQGLDLLRQARIAEAIPALERAAEGGSAEASAVLGDVLLTAADPLRAPWRAIAHLERAWSRGQTGAALTLAAAHYAAAGVPADDARAAHWLKLALATGQGAAWRVAGMLAHLAGRDEEAAAAMRRAAAMKDPFAQHALGRFAERAGDVPLARAWYGNAAAAGLHPSRLRLSALGAGPMARLPVLQASPVTTEVEARFPPLPATDAAADELVAPTTWRCRGLLDPLLCDYLIAASIKWMLKAMTVDGVTGKETPDPARNSWGMNFHFAFPDICVAYAERRIAARAGIALAHAEPLSVLRYEVGQEYRLHYDFMTPGSLANNPYYRRVGQRVATVITYLNLPDAGGATDFPRRGIVMVPEVGTGVKFNNTLPDGRPDEDTLHAGLPVLRGEKWVATLWFRENLVRETAPPPARGSEA